MPMPKDLAGKLRLPVIGAPMLTPATPELVESSGADVIFSPYFNGVACNWLKPSIAEMGLDPEDPKLLLKSAAEPTLRTENIRHYTDILCAGQGVGGIGEIQPAGVVIDRLAREYRDALSAFPTEVTAR